MDKKGIAKLLADNGVVLYGHFELRSGGHSPYFIQFARIAQDPEIIDDISEEMVKKFKGLDIDAVLTPSAAGLVYGFNIARNLHATLVFADLDGNGNVSHLRRGFELHRRNKVLVINDIMTSGRGVKDLCSLVTMHGATVEGVGLFASRYSDDINRLNLPTSNIKYLVKFNMGKPANKKECEFCKQGIELILSKELY